MPDKKVGESGWFFLECGCVVFVVKYWRLHTLGPGTKECPESQRLHAAFAEVAVDGTVHDTLPQRRAINEHYGVPEKITAAFESRYAGMRLMERPERVLVDGIGEVTGWYYLRCGCRIFVKYPGCYVHVVDEPNVCDTMRGLNCAYRQKLRNSTPDTPDALDDYIAMLRHVGTPDSKVSELESRRNALAALGKGR
ncbi:hypothetical protein [Streptomyces sp. NPDC127098]|uniref:hypothetical protein n=1 Tax=Streptomyces sp. NPDC127098 TaxID=3347137 RepID=UPI00366815FF